MTAAKVWDKAAVPRCGFLMNVILVGVFEAHSDALFAFARIQRTSAFCFFVF